MLRALATVSPLFTRISTNCLRSGSSLTSSGAQLLPERIHCFSTVAGARISANHRQDLIVYRRSFSSSFSHSLTCSTLAHSSVIVPATSTSSPPPIPSSQKMPSSAPAIADVQLNWSLSPEEILSLSKEIIQKSKQLLDSIATLPANEQTFDRVILPLAQSEGILNDTYLRLH